MPPEMPKFEADPDTGKETAEHLALEVGEFLDVDTVYTKEEHERVLATLRTARRLTEDQGMKDTIDQLFNDVYERYGNPG